MLFGGACHFGGLLAFGPRPVWAALLALKGSKVLALFAGHALCDYPLQGQFLSDLKNPVSNRDPQSPWWLGMFAHCSIHAAMVLFITGSLWFALAELGIHWATDYAKCINWINFRTDQAVHYGCKILWGLL
jgi:hypothetical protein